MRILAQSASLSYCPLLALPAPKIAGLLPASVATARRVSPPPKPFVFDDPHLAVLPDTIRAQFDKLVSRLLEVTIGLLADERAEGEFTLAAKTFIRLVTALYHDTIIGDSKPVIESPFAHRRQELNDKIDRMVAESRAHLAEATERIARELAALHAQEDAR